MSNEHEIRSASMVPMYSYEAYGLGIRSEFNLPELIPAPHTQMDVEISVEKRKVPPADGGPEGCCFYASPEEAHFFWNGVGTFVVRGGREIIVDALPNADEKIVRLPLLGIVFAMLLYQRGFLVLHGNAVAMNGAGVLFLGDKGSGKSTTAAALYARGYSLVADDVAALSFDGDGPPLVLPAFPQVKLWPEAAFSALRDDPRSLPRLHPNMEKRARRIDSRFAREPVSLRKIFILHEGSALRIHRAGPGEAMMHLIANTFAGRFGQRLLQDRNGLHFRQCSELARRIAVYRLERPCSLKLLPKVTQLLKDHLFNDSCPLDESPLH